MAFYWSIDLLLDTGYFHFDYWKDDVLTWVLTEDLNLEYAAHGYSRRELQDLNLYYFLCPNVLPACMSVQSPQKQKTALDPPELELQTVVSHHVGPGKQTSVLCKSNQVLLIFESSLHLPLPF